MKEQVTLKQIKRVYSMKAPTHMGLSFDGLERLSVARRRNIRRGDAVLFHNRDHTKAKVMIHDGIGTTIIYKRLDEGKFPSTIRRNLPTTDLKYYLQGEGSYSQYKEEEKLGLFSAQKRLNKKRKAKKVTRG
ncbi:MAG: IS66 family insertion sequence element accessory protein TnpB [Candidatus Heimdallarchaeaceae archaeon]